jgi:dTDP-4-amino-4,6-dideoxygalactose transaminase
VPLLDLGRQWETIREEVLAEVARVFDENDFILGKRVEALEREVAAYCGVEHAVALASGTDALLLTLKAMGVGPGDEVVTTPFTFFATAGAIWNCGARPVFADIERDSFNIDAEKALALVTRRTRALLPVHLFGRCASMGPLMEISAATGIPVLEDAAQAIGAEYRGMRAGSMGDAGALSFYPSKNLGGAGDGGMVVTHRAGLADRLRMARNHGGRDRYHHIFVGTNSRLDGIQGAVLRAKLKRLESWHKARAEKARRYDSGLAGIAGLMLPAPEKQGRSVHNQYTIRTDKRDALKEHLAREGISTAVYYPVPLHMQPCFRSLGYREGAFPESERASREVLSLPVFPELTDVEQDRVIEEIRVFLGA